MGAVPALITARTLPGLYIATDRSLIAGTSERPKILLMGVPEDTGTLPDDEPVLVSSLADVADLCGGGSPLDEMALAVKVAFPNCDLYLGSAGPGSTPAVGSIAVVGPATANGTLDLYINKIHHYAIPVVDEDTADEVGTLIAAALNADEACPVAAVNTSGTVAITAKFGGTLGNYIDVRLNYGGATAGEETPAGLTVTITEPATGATDADLADLITAIADDDFDAIVCAWPDASIMADLRTEIVRRWGDVPKLYTVVYGAVADTTGNIKTFVEAVDDFRILAVGYEADSPNPPWLMAADFGATCEYRYNLGTTKSPHRGCERIALSTCGATPRGERFTFAEREALVGYGAATVAYDGAGRVLIEKEQTTAPGSALQEAWISRAWNRYLIQRMTARFANTALVSDDLDEIPEGCTAPRSVYAEYLDAGKVAASRGWFRDFVSYKAGLVVELDEADPDRLNILTTPTYAGQARKQATVVQFRRAAA